MVLQAYRMRAEAICDVGEFLKVIHVDSLSLKAEFTGGEARFITVATLSEIKEAMASIEDGHVMAETVNYDAQYTGERREGGW